jgi:hypothetical protein
MGCLCSCHKAAKPCGMCCKEVLHKPSEAEDKSKKVLDSLLKGNK